MLSMKKKYLKNTHIGNRTQDIWLARPHFTLYTVYYT